MDRFQACRIGQESKQSVTLPESKAKDALLALMAIRPADGLAAIVQSQPDGQTGDQ
jgi:hypothetical protein